jgi:hypothetical protein
MGAAASASGLHAEVLANRRAEAVLLGEISGNGARAQGGANTAGLDLNLPNIMEDPMLWLLFREWLGGVFGDRLMAFWTDVQEVRGARSPTKARFVSPSLLFLPQYELMGRSGADAKILTARAKYLFTTYIKSGGKIDIMIDQVERDGIKAALNYNPKSNAVKQRKTEVILMAFNAAKHKVFQKLRFDYLPEFLSGTNFEELAQAMRNRMIDESEGRESQIYDDGSNMLSSPYILRYFKRYLSWLPPTEEGIHHDQFVECLLEMRDYRRASAPTARADRLAYILSRYEVLAIPKLRWIQDDFDAKPGKFASPQENLLDDVFDDIIAQLGEQHMENFRSSMVFKELNNAWDELESHVGKSCAPCSPVYKVKGLASRADEAHAEVKMMQRTDGKNQSRLSSKHRKRQSVICTTSGDVISLGMLLDDPLGLSLFRKYNYERFQEENINFWIAVAAYRRDDLVAPQGCTQMQVCARDTTWEELRSKRAQMIFEEFVAEGSPQQVNISTSMRGSITERMQAGPAPRDLFDEAHAEVFKLMKLNLWNKFTETNMFSFFSEKFRQKEARQAIYKQTIQHSASFSRINELREMESDGEASNESDSEGDEAEEVVVVVTTKQQGEVQPPAADGETDPVGTSLPEDSPNILPSELDGKSEGGKGAGELVANMGPDAVVVEGTRGTEGGLLTQKIATDDPSARAAQQPVDNLAAVQAVSRPGG